MCFEPPYFSLSEVALEHNLFYGKKLPEVPVGFIVSVLWGKSDGDGGGQEEGTY